MPFKHQEQFVEPLLAALSSLEEDPRKLHVVDEEAPKASVMGCDKLDPHGRGHILARKHLRAALRILEGVPDTGETRFLLRKVLSDVDSSVGIYWELHKGVL